MPEASPKSIKGTQTEKNLLTAFAGESQARNRYNYYASQAEKEGYMQIGEIFSITADQERLHAKRFFKFLEGGEAEVTSFFPAGVIGTTEENLKEAAAGENHEYSSMYPDFAETAKAEGFNEIAAAFRAVCVAEEVHEKRFLKLLENLQNGKVFERDTDQSWYCRKCGYVHVGTSAPKMCPACLHPQPHFELKAENY